MRCKCCNSALKSNEIIWIPDQNRHEDLCSRCRSNIFMDFLDAGWPIEKTYMYTSAMEEDTDDS